MLIGRFNCPLLMYQQKYNGISLSQRKVMTARVRVQYSLNFTAMKLSITLGYFVTLQRV